LIPDPSLGQEFLIYSFIFWSVLGFELRALTLLGRCSVTQAMSPSPFYFSYFFNMVLCLRSVQPGPHSYLYFLHLLGDRRALPPRPAFIG
jgi:hypothetical protein